MKSRCLPLLLVAAAAVVLGSAAAVARASVSRSSLALMPLPKAELGAAASLLPLDQQSGVQTNADAARAATGKVTAVQLDKLGRITGYELDYNDAAGHALAARRGLLEVNTGVELYRSPAAARNGLAFWRRDVKKMKKLGGALGISVSLATFTTTGLPRPLFAATTVVKLKGKPPLYATDVAFVSKQLLGEVAVTAADAQDRRAYTVSLAKKLKARIDGVLAGRIAGPPVQLPGKAKAGPPKNGPKLTLLTLTPSDLGGGTVKQQGYRLDKNLSPLSEYVRTMSPAGPFVYVTERVALFHSATEASFAFSGLSSTLSSPSAMTLFGPTNGVTSYHPTAVAVHVGDEATAVRATVGGTGGRTVNEAGVVIRVGASVEFLIVASPATVPIPVGQIQGLAAAAASRAAAGLRK